MPRQHDTTPSIPPLSKADTIAALARISEANDPWAALVAWLDERRRLNLSVGGDDAAFIGTLLMQNALWALPVRSGGTTKPRQSEEPFFSREYPADLLANLRHHRIKRAKEILKVIQTIEHRGVSVEPDLLLDHAAQELAVLLFGKV